MKEEDNIFTPEEYNELKKIWNSNSKNSLKTNISKQNKYSATVQKTNQKYSGTKHSLLHKFKLTKSTKLKIAAALATGTLAIGSLFFFIAKHNNLPEASDNISNYSATISASSKNKLEDFSKEFSNLSANSSKEDLKNFASDLYKFRLNLLKGQIANAYNSTQDKGPQKIDDFYNIQIYRKTQNLSTDRTTTYTAYITLNDGSKYSISLSGETITNEINNIIALQSYDPQKNTFEDLEKPATELLKEEPFVLSYNQTDRHMKSYSIEKGKNEKTTIITNELEDIDR